MLSRWASKTRSLFDEYVQLYYNNWALKHYSKKNYQALPKKLSKFSKYKKVKLGGFPFIFYMIDEANIECLKQFLSKIQYQKELLYDQDNPLKMTPVQFAYLNFKPEVIELLQQYGGNIHFRNSLQQNILHLAAIGNKIEGVKTALKEGIDINVQDTYKNTPLHYAAKAGNLELLEILLDKKAKTDIYNVQDKLPIHMATESGNIDAVKMLNKLHPNIQYANTHPIHLAATLQNAEILKLFINQNNSKVHTLDKERLTPLHYAILGNSTPCLFELLRNDVDINKQDMYGNTPLHLAVLENHLDCAKILVDNGANVHIKNDDKLTPIDCSFTTQSKEIQNFFKQLGRTDIIDQYFNKRI